LVDKSTLKEGANIAYGEYVSRIYPLWGTNLRNKLFYFEPENKQSWLKQIKENKIKYIFVTKNGPEESFLNGNNHFIKTAEDDTYEVFEIR